MKYSTPQSVNTKKLSPGGSGGNGKFYNSKEEMLSEINPPKSVQKEVWEEKFDAKYPWQALDHDCCYTAAHHAENPEELKDFIRKTIDRISASVREETLKEENKKIVTYLRKNAKAFFSETRQAMTLADIETLICAVENETYNKIPFEAYSALQKLSD
jgi:hypothetical protein